MANSRSRQQGRNRQEGRGTRSHSEGHEEWSGSSRPGFGRGEGDEERFDRNVQGQGQGQGRGFGRDFEREEGNGYGRQFESSSYGRGTQTADQDREFSRGRDEEDWGGSSESWNRGSEGRVDFNSPSGGFGGGPMGSGGRQQQSRYGSTERYGSPQYGEPGSFRSSSGRHTGRGPKNYQRDDTRIQEDISEQLTRHPDIDPSEVEIMVSDGEVTLTGVVESKQVKRMIEDIAESSSGVTDVQNQLRVENGARSQTSGRFTSDEEEDEDESSSRSRRGSSGGRSSGSRRGRSQSTASSSRQAARNKGHKSRQR